MKCYAACFITSSSSVSALLSGCGRLGRFGRDLDVFEIVLGHSTQGVCVCTGSQDKRFDFVEKSDLTDAHCECKAAESCDCILYEIWLSSSVERCARFGMCVVVCGLR